MANNQLDQEIRLRIDRFLGDLTLLVKKSALDSVRDALGQGGARALASGGGGTGRKPGRPAGRGNRGGMAAEQVLEHIRAHPGLRLEELGTSIGTPTKNLKGAIASLLKDGALRTEGQRRGTRYFTTGSSGGAGASAGSSTRRKAAKGRRKSRKSAKKKAA